MDTVTQQDNRSNGKAHATITMAGHDVANRDIVAAVTASVIAAVRELRQLDHHPTSPKRKTTGQAVRHNLTASQLARLIGTSATWVGKFARRCGVQNDPRYFDHLTGRYSREALVPIRNEKDRGRRLRSK